MFDHILRRRSDWDGCYYFSFPLPCMLYNMVWSQQRSYYNNTQQHTLVPPLKVMLMKLSHQWLHLGGGGLLQLWDGYMDMICPAKYGLPPNLNNNWMKGLID